MEGWHRGALGETQMLRFTALLTFLTTGALLVSPPIASAAPCRRLCRPAIQRCVDAGNRRRRCKLQLIQMCKQLGQQACDEAFLPPTTLPPPTTTSTTTTTTQPVYATTTTTSPGFSVTGTWYLSSSVICGSSACCPIDGNLTSVLYLTESGPLGPGMAWAIDGWMGSVAVVGAVNYPAGTWSVWPQGGQYCDADQCCVSFKLTVGSLSNSASTLMNLLAWCPGSGACTLQYEGTIGR